MGEFGSLLLVLGIIYAVECLHWVPSNALFFVAWFGPGFRVRAPSGVVGNQRGGVVLANPFPPLGRTFLAGPLPFLLSPDGIATLASSTPHCLNYGAIQTIRVDQKKLLINKVVFVVCGSQAQARFLAALIGKLQKEREEGRGALIEDIWCGQFSGSGIQTRMSDAAAALTRLRFLGNLVFGILFVGAPAVFFQFNSLIAWLVIGVALLGLMWAQAWNYRRAHRRLHGVDNDSWWAPFLTMLLAAPTAIRAHDHLSRDLLVNFHPVAVAWELGGREEGGPLAEQFLRRLRFPAGSSVHPEEEWHRRASLKALEQFLISKEVSISELLAAPEPEDARQAAYCPRCLAQFTAEARVCPDCSGRALEPLAQAAAKKATQAGV